MLYKNGRVVQWSGSRGTCFKSLKVDKLRVIRRFDPPLCHFFSLSRVKDIVRSRLSQIRPQPLLPDSLHSSACYMYWLPILESRIPYLGTSDRPTLTY